MLKASNAFAERFRLPPSIDAIGRLQLPGLGQPEWLRATQELSASMSRLLKPCTDAMQSLARAMEPMRERLAELAIEGEKCRRLEKAGWLPHSTSPLDEFASDDMEPAEISAIMERHYRDNWAEICNVFLDDLEGYDIDDEAKATFKEALEVHRNGHYRASCRVLFPEIERVSRIEIHEGALEGFTSQKELGKRMGHLTPGEFGTGLRGMALYRKFTDHIYAPVKTEAALLSVLSDPVPNRHVALHGLSAYTTFQHSLNVIIICDFVFRAISALKRYTEEDDAEAA